MINRKKCQDCGNAFEPETNHEPFCEDCANAYNEDADTEMLGDDAGFVHDVGAK